MESSLPPADTAAPSALSAPSAPSAPSATVTPDGRRPHVSIRSIYEEALRDVMADPRKAIAEHDPCLASLLGPLAAPLPKP